MPESKVRKSAAEKKKVAEHKKVVAERVERLAKAPGANRWVPAAFITTGLLGVAWIVVFNLAREYIPFMEALGNWNYMIGIGLMAVSLIIATQWK